MIKYLPDFIVIAVIYVFLLRKWKNGGRIVVIANTLMLLYLTAVLFVTLMPIIVSLPSMFSHPYVPMNLNPFGDLLNNRGDAVRQIILNIIMTIPFGFLLPICQKCAGGKSGPVRCAALTLALSVCIELLQPLIGSSRSSDITDIITNTLGGIIGYIIFLIFRPLTDRIIDRLRNRQS